MTTEPKRTCYAILAGQRDEQGYIPSLVTEGEAGHAPLAGRGTAAQPWHWGRTYDEAKETCARMNQQDFGLTEREAAEIMLSSMAADRL